jgi:nucleoside-diphosphate-sugar epimerase
VAERSQTLAVTGANGFVGSCVVSFLRNRGYRVIALRHDLTEPSIDGTQQPYSLSGPVPIDALRETGGLIHCAHDFGQRSWDDIVRVNVEGSTRLLKAAREAGVRSIVLVSTVSAFEGCQSLYGRSKLKIEQVAQALGATVVRPGLVFGGDAGGALLPLRRLVARSRVVPLVVGGHQQLHLVHREDLCQLLLRAIESGPAASRVPITAASKQAFTLREIMETLAASQGRRVVFAPVSWRLIWACLKFAEVVGLPLRLGSDSLRSLLHPPAHLRVEEAPLGVRLRSFSAESAAG